MKTLYYLTNWGLFNYRYPTTKTLIHRVVPRKNRKRVSIYELDKAKYKYKLLLFLYLMYIYIYICA